MESQTHPMLQQTSRSNLGGGRDKIARLATSISPPLCLVAWYTLPIYIPPGNQRSRQNKQLKDQQNRIIAVRKCPGLVLAQDNSGHLQWLHSFCALDILHDTSTGSHKELICAHNLDFVPWTQIYDLIPGSQSPSMCSHSRLPLSFGWWITILQ